MVIDCGLLAAINAEQAPCRFNSTGANGNINVFFRFISRRSFNFFIVLCVALNALGCLSPHACSEAPAQWAISPPQIAVMWLVGFEAWLRLVVFPHGLILAISPRDTMHVGNILILSS